MYHKPIDIARNSIPTDKQGTHPQTLYGNTIFLYS